MNRLIILDGLSGIGKTTIARELARRIGAVHLRIDSIEQAIRECVEVRPPLDEAGYRIAYVVAEDNLRVGRIVIADSVNPLPVTRDAWLGVANRTGVSAIEIELKCSDADEHRRRVETRTADIPGLNLPTWQAVVSREYRSWGREHIVINTARLSVEESVKILQSASGHLK